LNHAALFYASVNQFIHTKTIQEIHFSQLLFNSKDVIQKLSNDSQDVYNALSKVNIQTNPELKEKLDLSISSLEVLKELFSTLEYNFDEILSLLGHERSQKYAIILQNADEIRPLG
jgi:glutaredoxin 2